MSSMFCEILKLLDIDSTKSKFSKSKHQKYSFKVYNTYLLLTVALVLNICFGFLCFLPVLQHLISSLSHNVRINLSPFTKDFRVWEANILSMNSIFLKLPYGSVSFEYVEFRNRLHLSIYVLLKTTRHRYFQLFSLCGSSSAEMAVHTNCAPICIERMQDKPY